MGSMEEEEGMVDVSRQGCGEERNGERKKERERKEGEDCILFAV